VASWRLSGVVALEFWLQQFVGGPGNQEEKQRWTSNARMTSV
jgi:hypothetical protein